MSKSTSNIEFDIQDTDNDSDCDDEPSITSKKTNKTKLFKKLSNYEPLTSISRFVNVAEFDGEYVELRFGNGGGWSRLDGDFGKKHKICVVKTNGTKRFSWTPTEKEINEIEIELLNYMFSKGTSIMLIKICGLQELSASRPIRTDIRKVLVTQPCVVCGTNSQIEIDHKNGLYNDPRVLNSKSQLIDDFQALCKHCNDQKRQTCVWQKKHNQRYPASKIPQLALFGIDFVEGNETFSETDINALVGTYWYDPVEFMKKILNNT